MLSRFKLSFREIKDIIIKLDTTQLSQEDYMVLKKIAPTPEEIELVKEYTGDVSVLGKAEQFILEVCVFFLVVLITLQNLSIKLIIIITFLSRLWLFLGLKTD